MSRKQFSTGLDSAFSDAAQHEPNIDNSPWLADTLAEVKPRTASAKRSGTRPRRPGKSFTSDLESLFAVAAAVAAEPAAKAEEEFQARQRNRPRRRGSGPAGLDGLIRDTTDGKAVAAYDKAAAEELASVRKRVTFTYDRDRFAQLKSIARTEGSYLKDIISALLNDYIQEYERAGGDAPR